MPTIVSNPAWASSSVSTPVAPPSWNSDAAMISIAMLARPASVIAMATSMRWKPSTRRLSSSVVTGSRFWVSAECR